MIPEINISQFSEENIVTTSALGQARTAIGIDETAKNSKIVYTNMNDWVERKN